MVSGLFGGGKYLNESGLEGFVVGEDGDVFEFSLRYEHSIEGVAMGNGEASGSEGVG
ncbi:MAG: hypothetical protein Kow00121_09630 [Elainellaceae cyanobacterium]